VLTGFNTDIKFAERVYHVQTEDRGLGNPVVESLVYVGGEILLSKKSPYTQHVQGDRVDEKAVRELMDLQHRRIIEAIRRGRLDAKKQAPGSTLEWGDEIYTSEPNVSPAAIAAVAAMLAVPSEPLPGDRPRGAPPRTEGAPPPKKAAGPPPATKPATPALAAKASAPPATPAPAPPASTGARPAATASSRRPSAPSHTPLPFPSAIAPSVKLPSPAAEPVPQKSPTVTSGSRTLDQVIVEYLASEAASERLELALTLGGEFTSGESVAVTAATTTSITRKPVANAQITIRIISTSQPPQVLFRGVTGNDGLVKVTCAVPDTGRSNAAVIVSASSPAGSSEIKHLVRRKAR
jgi:hypothetical protein